MIKRPVLPLMLLTLASIFLFFLLNLLLGSVHICLLYTSDAADD